MKRRRYYVYVLVDLRKPGTYRYGHWTFQHEPFYVGKGTGNRYRAHSLRANPAVQHKVNMLKSMGFSELAVIKKAELTEREAYALEKRLIQRVGRQDLKQGPLLNFGDGGGVGRSNYTQTDAEKRKRSRALKKYWASMKPEQRAAMREKAVKANAERSDAKKAAMRKKISEKAKVRNADPIFKQRQSRATKAYWRSLTPRRRANFVKKLSEGQQRRRAA